MAALWLICGACGSGLNFKPVPMDQAPTEYRSSTWATAGVVELERFLNGLRCVVLSTPDPTRSHYGGVMVPAKGAKGCRLDMTFSDSQNIVMAYVDAYNARKQRVARWQTDQWPRLPGKRTVYQFIPERPAKDFKPAAAPSSGEIATFHVFIAIKPGTGASFAIHRVELAK